VRVHAVWAVDASAKREQDSRLFDVERIRGAGVAPPNFFRRRTTREVPDHAHGSGVAADSGSTRRRRDVSRSSPVEQSNDVLSTEARRKGHRWTPIALSARQNILMQQRGIAHNESAHRAEIIAPNGGRELHTMNEPRPARRLIAASEYELRVREHRG